MAGKPPNPPPLGLEIPNLRECSRDMDFPKGVPCGKEPFLHVYWTDGEYHQEQCTTCGYWTIWRRGASK